MSGNSAMSSAVSVSRSHNTRFRATAGAALIVTMGSAILVGCGKTSTPTRPLPVLYEPDLRAYEAYLYWGASPIGGPMRAGDARLGERAGVARVAHDINSVVVGTTAMPALRVTSQGVSGVYGVQFYIDDQLWWEVGGPAPTPAGVVDHFGKTWVPADTGVHVLRMVVDPDNLVAEVDETNNEQRLEVKVIPGDLWCAILPFIQERDGHLQEVDDAQVNTMVVAVVLTAAEGSYLDYRQVLNECGTVVLDRRASLSGGTLWNAARLDTIKFVPTTPGTCQMRFDVDPDVEFPMDRNRTNNTSSRTLTVHP